MASALRARAAVAPSGSRALGDVRFACTPMMSQRFGEALNDGARLEPSELATLVSRRAGAIDAATHVSAPRAASHCFPVAAPSACADKTAASVPRYTCLRD